jgi:hypothetical protein
MPESFSSMSNMSAPPRRRLTHEYYNLHLRDPAARDNALTIRSKPATC